MTAIAVLVCGIEYFAPSDSACIFRCFEPPFFLLQAFCCGDKPALEALFFDGILGYDEFVVIEACFVIGGRYVIMIFNLFVCRPLMRACFCILLR